MFTAKCNLFRVYISRCKQHTSEHLAVTWTTIKQHLACFPKLFSKSRIPFFILRDRRNNALRKMLHFKKESICPCRFLIISKDKKVFPKNFFVWRDIKNIAWQKVFLLMKENFFVMHFSCYLFMQKNRIFQISWVIALSFWKRPDATLHHVYLMANSPFIGRFTFWWWNFRIGQMFFYERR